MPVVEAQAVGTPVVVSRVSSLPEIAGSSGIYIDDPLSIDSIRSGLEKAIGLTASERLKLIKEGKENVKRFDWDISSARILSILKTV